MTFCNQFASPQHAGVVLDLDGDGCHWLPLAQLGIPDSAMGGLTGVCRVGDELVLATQSTPPLIVLYDPLTGRIKASRDLSPCLDPHSLVWHEGAILVVSTGTNEIYRVPLDADGFGAPCVQWRYPGVAYDQDLVHLNGLTVSARGLIASCFGPRRPDGSWGAAGLVFQVEPYEVIQGGLCQPHTPLCCGERLFFAESRDHRVHSLRRAAELAWRAEPPIVLDGYARGLACRDDRIWVGLSAARKVSRSKGTPNQGVVAGTGAAVVCVDLASRTLIERRPLGAFGEEVYDLLLLEPGGPLESTVEALAQRIGGIQAWQDKIREEYVATHEALDKTMAIYTEQRLLAVRLQEDLTREQARGLALAETLQQERAVAEQHAQREHAVAEQHAQRERAAVEQSLRQALAQAEQCLEQESARAARLAGLLRLVGGSRLWRSAERLRRLLGRPPLVVDPGPWGDAAPPPSPLALADLTHPLATGNVLGGEAAGSERTRTAGVRELLPGLLREFGVRTMLDLPSGDLHATLMLELDIAHLGVEVVADLVGVNSARQAGARRRFQVIDLATDALPRVDLVFCRDLLLHCSFADALRVIHNLKRSGSTYLLTTTFTDRAVNLDSATGEWRALNLALPPFALPPPLRLLDEHSTAWGADWADKCLGLWRLTDVPIAPTPAPLIEAT